MVTDDVGTIQSYELVRSQMATSDISTNLELWIGEVTNGGPHPHLRAKTLIHEHGSAKAQACDHNDLMGV